MNPAKGHRPVKYQAFPISGAPIARFVLWGMLITLSEQALAQGRAGNISGFVREAGSGEVLEGITVIADGEANKGTATNRYGFFSLPLSTDSEVVLRFSGIGYATEVRKIKIADQSEGIEVVLTPETFHLDGVVVKEKTKGEAGFTKLDLQIIRETPALLGEKDVIKSLQLIPGVKMGTEGFSSFHVRGGGADQNLILLDEAPVYNAHHLFGLFSSFNTDAIRSASFWKGTFPARYGGRLSSVTNIQMKEGNRQKLSGEGGVGLASSRFTLEGPLKKGKSSFLIAARHAYLGLFMKAFSKGPETPDYGFYDVDLKVNWQENPKSKFFLSAYLGQDRLAGKTVLNRESSSRSMKQVLAWGNATATFRWNRQISSKAFLNTTAYFTKYRFSLSDKTRFKSEYQDINTSAGNFSVLEDIGFKVDGDFFAGAKHTLKSGTYFITHRYLPQAYVFENYNLDMREEQRDRFRNQEWGLYIEDNWQLAKSITMNAGLRLAGLFAADDSGIFPEPRLNLRWEAYQGLEISVSYNRMHQLVHQLSNTGTGLVTDLWVPVRRGLPVQQADQISAGLVKSFPGKNWTVTLETYRKWMKNVVAYKEGAAFLVLSEGPRQIDWQNNITTGNGWSYGTEVFIEKSSGRLTGNLGYTLSWAIHQFDEINEGKRFFAGHDRRHYLTLSGAYRLKPRITLSFGWMYASGNRMTVPQGYTFGIDGFHPIQNRRAPDFIDYLGPRNSFRAEDYHRLDLGIQFHKEKKRVRQYWEIGLFNAYMRKNPTYYYLQYNQPRYGEASVNLKKRALFPVVPSISYNIKF